MLLHLLCPGLYPQLDLQIGSWTEMLHGSHNTGITIPGRSSCLPCLGLCLTELAPCASGRGVCWSV